jgi:WD40 repeat protein/transcriptional regulator with XRE-family HTH domain
MATRQAADQTGESFQGLLLRHRGRTGLTQRELAARVGVSKRTLQDWEAGVSYPGAERLQALIAAFLSSGGQAAGREAVEARELWSTALREAPRLHTPFDPDWFAELLAQRTGSAGRETRPAKVLAEDRQVVQQRHDWGDAPDVAGFLGRAHELATLKRWVMEDHCRLVAILGLGGVGKTMLAARLAQEAAPSFERVFWRTVRNAPLLSEGLPRIIGVLSGQQLAAPAGEAAQLALVAQLLRERPTLLVLDNLETLLEPGVRQARYREGYGGFGELVEAFGEGRHRSCIILTSRETPPRMGAIGDARAVRVLELGGLSVAEGQALLADKQLSGAEHDWANLVAHFGGNGLALKVVGESIRQLFGGQLGRFFEEAGPAVFGDIRQLLDEQVERSSAMEQYLLKRLAIERVAVGIPELLTDLTERVGRGAALEALEALRRRSLVEHAQPGVAFTLQSVVLEYMTDRLVEQVGDEIARGQPGQLLQHPLIRAQAKDFVRRTQERFIGEPILQHLVAARGSGGAERRLLDLLDGWRDREPAEQAYGPGNVVNLLRLLRRDLKGVDLSHLRLRQVYLQDLDAQDASLADAGLAEAVLAEVFAPTLCTALSADGGYVAAGTVTGEVRVWRVADRTLVFAVAAHTGPVWSVALTADGRLVASGGGDDTARLWDVPSSRSLAVLEGHTAAVYSVALSTDGQLAATAGQDGTVRLWDLAFAASDRGEPSTARRPVSAVSPAASPSMGRSLAVLDGHAAGVYAVTLSADGQLVASGGQDGAVRLWDWRGGRCLAVLEGHSAAVWGVALSSDTQLVASTGQDGTLHLWDANSGQRLAVLHGHTAGVRTVAVSADGQLVASGGWDGTLRLWDTRTARCLAVLEGHVGEVRGVALSADGSLVSSVGWDSTLRLWDSLTSQCLAVVRGHSDMVGSVALSSDGQIVASSGGDGTVRLWDAASGEQFNLLSGRMPFSRGMALSVDGHRLATGDKDGSVRVWDSRSGQCLIVLEGHTGEVWAVGLSADGELVAGAGQDGTVRLWDSRTGRCLVVVDASPGEVWGMALSADGRLAASGGGQGRVLQLWDTSSGRCLANLEGHTAEIWSVALSADGQLAASGAGDGTVCVWQTSSGRRAGPLGGHRAGVTGVALSADGQLLATGSVDTTVRLWDTRSGECHAILEGHTAGVWGVAMSGDGRLVASGGADGTVRLWDTASATQLRSLRSDRIYERMDITGLTGVTAAQRQALVALGAEDRSGG